jgi:RHS repeat-associated protein
MILHEEGRIRVYEPVNNPRVAQGANFDLPDNNKGVFEFFIKDNLQNTRMVLTEETHSEFNNATMETANSYYEELMFGQVDVNGVPVNGVNEVQETRKDKQTWAPGWNANTSEKISKISYFDKKVGPNMVLKVMAGDNVAAKTDYYYTGTPDNSDNNNILGLILSTLLGTLNTTAPTGNLHGSASSITNNYNTNPGALGNFLANQSNGGNTTPQAYLNILFFDENFNFVPYDDVTGLGSYAWRVNSAGDAQSIPLQVSKAPKNGYAFVYLSNESKTPVYFDNFEVTHIRGRITEENAYYPYGLKIQGLSAKAFDKGKNNYGYQGDFSEGEEETGWDEFDLRMYDAQIGRWTGIDPYDQFSSPYIGMGSDPVNNTDPNGGSIGAEVWGAIFGAAGGFATGYLISKATGASQGSAIAWGLAGSFVGAGIGYGLAATLWGDPYEVQSGGFLKQFLAFYGGLFGASGDVNFNGYNGKAAGYPATIPKIWNVGSGGGSIGNVLPIIAKTVVDIKPEVAIRLRKQESITPPRSIRDIPPCGKPTVNRCHCFTVVTTTPARNIPFNYTGNSPVGMSFTDSDISKQQFDVINDFISKLSARMMSGDFVRGATFVHTMNFGGVMPVNNIPTPLAPGMSTIKLGGSSMLVGGAMVDVDPSTGRRWDSNPGDWRTSSGFPLRPVRGAGNTIMQHYESQTRLMGNLLRLRLGPNIVGTTTWGNPNPRYQFSGRYGQPAGTVRTRVCLCGN